MSDRQELESDSVRDPAVREPLSVLLLGNFLSQSVYVAVKLRLAELLDDGPASVESLAERSGAHARSLDLILRVLEIFGVFARDAEGRVVPAPLAGLLKQAGFRTQVTLLGEEYYRAAAELLHTATTGQPAFEKVFGAGFYEYFASDAGGGRFNELMEQSAPVRYADVPQVYDFSKVSRLVDVGGGRGALTALLLKAQPDLQAVIYDTPSVIAGARPFLEREQVLDRCELVAGDFFEAVPPGGDVYLTAAVVSNWNDERAARILANCRAAMNDAGRLVMVETLSVPTDAPSAFKALLTLASWVVQGSSSRTQSEYEALLRRAGFRLRSVRKLGFEPFALIDAEPV